MKLEFLSQSLKETQALARLFLKEFKNSDQPLILALSGNLGAGKTTFTQGLAKALGVKDRVVSPTFVVMKSFLIPGGSRQVKLGRRAGRDLAISGKHFLWHIDCWRLDQSDFEYLGLKEILENQENIVCLEWAERVKKLLPRNAILLKFEHLGGNKRKIMIGKISN
jgi:tRNA threonylcarbamoyladenosine biosynthesis protein TsaE